jgi:hypothetical protein
LPFAEVFATINISDVNNFFEVKKMTNAQTEQMSWNTFRYLLENVLKQDKIDRSALADLLSQLDDGRIENISIEAEDIENPDNLRIIIQEVGKYQIKHLEVSSPADLCEAEENKLDLVLAEELPKTKVTYLNIVKKNRPKKPVTLEQVQLLTKSVAASEIVYFKPELYGMDTPEKLAALTSGLAESKVLYLELPYSILDAKAKDLAAFAEGLRGTSVECLKLSNNWIDTPEKLLALTSGLVGTKVKQLELSNNRIAGRESVAALLEGLRGTEVTELYLNDNKISNADFEWLRENLAETKVETILDWRNRAPEDAHLFEDDEDDENDYDYDYDDGCIDYGMYYEEAEEEEQAAEKIVATPEQSQEKNWFHKLYHSIVKQLGLPSLTRG